jgi:predicted transcriptional regulator
VLTFNLGENKMNKKDERCVLTSVIETELDILKRHIHVLKTLQEHQPMGIIKLSELTNYPQHMVRYSLRILEQDNLIEPSPQGAVTRGDISKTLELLKKTLKNITKTSNEILKTLD